MLYCEIKWITTAVFSLYLFKLIFTKGANNAGGECTVVLQKFGNPSEFSIVLHKYYLKHQQIFRKSPTSRQREPKFRKQDKILYLVIYLLTKISQYYIFIHMSGTNMWTSRISSWSESKLESGVVNQWNDKSGVEWQH